VAAVVDTVAKSPGARGRARLKAEALAKVPVRETARGEDGKTPGKAAAAAWKKTMATEALVEEETASKYHLQEAVSS